MEYPSKAALKEQREAYYRRTSDTNSSNLDKNQNTTSYVVESKPREDRSDTLNQNDENQEFPKSESWWPATSNEEWGQKDGWGSSSKYQDQISRSQRRMEQKTRKNMNKWPSDVRLNEKPEDTGKNYEEANGFESKPEPEGCSNWENPDESETRAGKNDPDSDYVELGMERVFIFYDISIDKLKKLKFGKEISEKTYLMPNSFHTTRIFVDCKLCEFELSQGFYCVNELNADERLSSSGKTTEGWSFFQKTTRTTTKLPEENEDTFSYQVEVEHVIMIPKNSPDLEIYYGTMIDPDELKNED